VVASLPKYHVKRQVKKMGASDSESDYSSDDSTSQSGSDDSLEITQEMLDQLFEEAKAEMIRKGKQKQLEEQSANADGEEIINVADSSSKFVVLTTSHGEALLTRRQTFASTKPRIYITYTLL
jgi:polyribonucleotide nucleotidyltransferase